MLVKRLNQQEFALTSFLSLFSSKCLRSHPNFAKLGPDEKCFCTLPPGAWPAKSPDFNIAENLFNMIQQELSRRGLTEGWPKNVDELEARIVEALDNARLEKYLCMPKASYFSMIHAFLPIKSWKF